VTSHPDTERVVSWVPVSYDAEVLDPAAVRRRIQYNEADAGRPGLPQHALQALFKERQALLRVAARIATPAPPSFFLDQLFRLGRGR
jgi:hypothetical protein